MTLNDLICIFSECPPKIMGLTYESRYEISNNVVCTTCKDTDQSAHMRSMIRVFVCPLNILGVFNYRPNIISSLLAYRRLDMLV